MVFFLVAAICFNILAIVIPIVHGPARVAIDTASPTSSPTTSPTSSPTASPTSSPTVSPQIASNLTLFSGTTDDYQYEDGGYYDYDTTIYTESQPHSLTAWGAKDVVVAQGKGPVSTYNIVNYDGTLTEYANLSNTYMVVHDAQGDVIGAIPVGFSTSQAISESLKKRLVYAIDEDYFLFRIERAFQNTNSRTLDIYNGSQVVQFSYPDLVTGVVWVKYNSEYTASPFLMLECDNDLSRGPVYEDLRFPIVQDDVYLYIPYSLDTVTDTCTLEDATQSVVLTLSGISVSSAVLVIKTTKAGVYDSSLFIGQGTLRTMTLLDEQLLMYITQDNFSPPLQKLNATGGVQEEYDVIYDGRLLFHTSNLSFAGETTAAQYRELYCGDQVVVAGNAQYNFTNSFECRDSDTDFVWIDKVGSWRVGLSASPTPTKMYGLNMKVSSSQVVAVSIDYFISNETVLNITTPTQSTLITLRVVLPRSNILLMIDDDGELVGYYLFEGLGISTTNDQQRQLAPVFDWSSSNELRIAWAHKQTNPDTTITNFAIDDRTPVKYTDSTSEVNYLRVSDTGVILT